MNQFLPPGVSVDDFHTHAARRARDHAHRGFDGGGIQVGHFGLGDLLNLFLRDLRDLLLVRFAGGRLNVARLLDQNGGRRRLRDKRERTVRVDRNDDLDDQPGILLRALVEFLRERHDVDAVLAESRANRRRRRCLAGRYLEFNVTRYLLSHSLLHLQNSW